MTSCKHCGEDIQICGNSGSYVHITGPYQVGMHTCALSPYGFYAEPVGVPCSTFAANPRNGSRGIVPT